MDIPAAGMRSTAAALIGAARGESQIRIRCRRFWEPSSGLSASSSSRRHDRWCCLGALARMKPARLQCCRSEVLVSGLLGSILYG